VKRGERGVEGFGSEMIRLVEERERRGLIDYYLLIDMFIIVEERVGCGD
jgi:hypothetical protein